MKKYKFRIIFCVLIIIQIVIQIIVGVNKEYIHMDEAYSLGLAGYDKTEIQDNEDFYNTWHEKEYYEDYLSIQDDEIGEYSQVYENQKNDVHPPLYYLILRIAMGFTRGHFSKWPGIVINIIMYVFITIFMYLIFEAVLKKEFNSKLKAVVISFVSSLTLASLTNVIYIRMYTLLTLMIVLTAFLHIKLLECGKANTKLLIFIGAAALAGSLTHYYYLFYLVMLFFFMEIKYLKEKNYKTFFLYALAMLTAGIISIIIFPYSIQHMFFGYRGKGVISNFKNIQVMFCNFLSYIIKLSTYGFNGLFIVVTVIIIVLSFVRINKRRLNNCSGNTDILKSLYLPIIFYFVMASVSSPWVELRYIMPVCGLIFALTIYCMYNLLSGILSVRKADFIVLGFFLLLLLTPFVLKIEPEVLYSDKKQIVSELESEFNVPAIYFFNSDKNRFLDDILLFSKLDESYIAKDLEQDEKNIRNIFREKDISKGIVVFINENQNDERILETLKNAENFKDIVHLKKLNACNVYYLAY